MADPVSRWQQDATWPQLFQPQRGGELAVPNDHGKPQALEQPQPQRLLDRSLVDTIAQERREDIGAAKQRQGTSAHELLARCRQLNAEHRCPGRCVFTGLLRRPELP